MHAQVNFLRRAKFMHEQLCKVKSTMMTAWLHHGQEIENFCRHGKKNRNFNRQIAFRTKNNHKKYPDTIQTVNRVRLRPGATPSLIIRCTLQLLHFKLIGLSSLGQVALLYMFLMFGLTTGVTSTQLIDHTTAVNTNGALKTIDLHSDTESPTNTLFPSFIDNTEYSGLFRESISSEKDENFKSSEMLLSPVYGISSLTDKSELSLNSHSLHIDHNPEMASDTTSASTRFQSFLIPLQDTRAENTLQTSYYTYHGNHARIDLETIQASDESEPSYDSLHYKNEESNLLVTYYTALHGKPPGDLTTTSKASEIFPSSTDSLPYTKEKNNLFKSYHTIQINEQPEMETKKPTVSADLTPFSASASASTNLHATLLTSYHKTGHEYEPEAMSETNKASKQFSSITGSMPNKTKEGISMTNYHETEQHNDPARDTEKSPLSVKFTPLISSLSNDALNSIMSNHYATTSIYQPETRSETSKLSELLHTFISLLSFTEEESSFRTIQTDDLLKTDSESGNTSVQITPLSNSLLYNSVQSTLWQSYSTALNGFKSESGPSSAISLKPTSFADSPLPNSSEGNPGKSYHTKKNDNQPNTDSGSFQQSVQFMSFSDSSQFNSAPSSLRTSFYTVQNYNLPNTLSETSTSEQFSPLTNLLPDKTVGNRVKSIYSLTQNGSQSKKDSQTRKPSIQLEASTNSLPYIYGEKSSSTSHYRTLNVNQLKTGSVASETNTQYLPFFNSKPFSNIEGSLVTSYYIAKTSDQLQTDLVKITGSVLPFLFSNNVNSSLRTAHRTIYSVNQSEKYVEQVQASEQLLSITDSSEYSYYSAVGDTLTKSYYVIQNKNLPETDSETSQASVEFTAFTDGSMSGKKDRKLRTSFYANPQTDSEKNEILIQSTDFVHSWSLISGKSKLNTGSSTALLDGKTSEFDRSSTEVVLHAMSTPTTIQLQEFPSLDMSLEIIDEIITDTLHLNPYIKPTNSYTVSDDTSKIVQSKATNSISFQTITTTELQSLTTHFVTTFADKTDIAAVDHSSILTSPPASKSSSAETGLRLMAAVERSISAQNTISDYLNELYTSYRSPNLVISSTSTLNRDFIDSHKALVSWDKPSVHLPDLVTSVTPDYSYYGSLSNQRRERATTTVSNMQMSPPVESSHESYSKRSTPPYKTTSNIDFQTQHAYSDRDISTLLSTLYPPTEVDSSNYDLSQILQDRESSSEIVLQSEKVMFDSEYSTMHRNTSLRSSTSTSVLPDTSINIRTTKTFDLPSSENSGLLRETTPQRDPSDDDTNVLLLIKTTEFLSLPYLVNNHKQTSILDTNSVSPPIDIGVSVWHSAQLKSSESSSLINRSYSMYQTQHMTQSSKLSVDQHRSKSPVNDSTIHSEYSAFTTNGKIFSPSSFESLTQIPIPSSTSAIFENVNIGISSQWNLLTQEVTAEIPVLSTSVHMEEPSFTRISFIDSLDSSFHYLTYQTPSTISIEMVLPNDDESLKNSKSDSLFSTTSSASSNHEQFSSTYFQMSDDNTVRGSINDNWIVSAIMENTPSVQSFSTEIDRQVKSSTAKLSTLTQSKVTGSSYSSKESNSQSLYEKNEQPSSLNENMRAFQSSSPEPKELHSSQSSIYFNNSATASVDDLNYLERFSSKSSLNLLSSTFGSEIPLTLSDDTNEPSLSISSVIGHSNGKSKVFAHTEPMQSSQDYKIQGSTKYVSIDHSSLKKNGEINIWSSATMLNELPQRQNASENYDSFNTLYLSEVTLSGSKSSTTFIPNIPSAALYDTSMLETWSASHTSVHHILQESNDKTQEENTFPSNTGPEFDIVTDYELQSHSVDRITTSFSIIPVTFSAQKPETTVLSPDKLSYPAETTHYVSDFTSLKLVTPYSSINMNNMASIRATKVNPTEKSISSIFDSVQFADLSIALTDNSILPRSHQTFSSVSLDSIVLFITQTGTYLPETQDKRKGTISQLNSITSDPIVKTSSVLIESESSRKDAEYSKMSHRHYQSSKGSITPFYSEHWMTKASSVTQKYSTSFNRHSLGHSDKKSLVYHQTKEKSAETSTSIIVTEPRDISSGEMTSEISSIVPSNMIKTSTFKQTESFPTVSEFLEIEILATLEKPLTDKSVSYSNSFPSRNSLTDLLLSNEVSSSQINVVATNKRVSESITYSLSLESMKTDLNLSDGDESTIFTLPDKSSHSEITSILPTSPLQEYSLQPEQDSKRITTFGNSSLFSVVTRTDIPLRSDSITIQDDTSRTILNEFPKSNSKDTRNTFDIKSMSSSGEVSETIYLTLNVPPTQAMDIINLQTTTEFQSFIIETGFIEKNVFPDKTGDRNMPIFRSEALSERYMSDIIILATSFSSTSFSFPYKTTIIHEAESGTTEKDFEETMISSWYWPIFQLQSTGSYTPTVLNKSTSNVSDLSNSTVTSNSSHYGDTIFTTEKYQTKSSFNREEFASETAASSSPKSGVSYSIFASSGMDVSFLPNFEIGISQKTATTAFSTRIETEYFQESQGLNDIISPVTSPISSVLQPTSSVPLRKTLSNQETVSGLRNNQSKDVSVAKSMSSIHPTASLLRSGTTKSSKFNEMYRSSAISFTYDIDKAISTTNDQLVITLSPQISSKNTESTSIISSSFRPILPVIVDSMTETVYLPDLPLYTSSEYVRTYELSNINTYIQSDSIFTTNDILLLPEKESIAFLFPLTLIHFVQTTEIESKSVFETIGASSTSSHILKKNTWESSTISSSDHAIQPIQPKNKQTPFSSEPSFETSVGKLPDVNTETTLKSLDGLSQESDFSPETSLITELQSGRFPIAHSSSTSRSLWETGATPIIFLSDSIVISSQLQSSFSSEDSFSMTSGRMPDQSTEFGITSSYHIFSSNEEHPYSTDQSPFSLEAENTVVILPSSESISSKSFPPADDNILIPELLSTGLLVEQSSTFSRIYSLQMTEDAVPLPTATIWPVSSRGETNDLSSSLVLALSTSEVQFEPSSTDADKSFSHVASATFEAHSMPPTSESHDKLLGSEKFVIVNTLTTKSRRSSNTLLSTSFEFSSPSQWFSKGRQASDTSSPSSFPHFATVQKEETKLVDKTLQSVMYRSPVISSSLSSRTLTLYPTLDLQPSGLDIKSSMIAGTRYISDDVPSIQKSKSTLTHEQSSSSTQHSGPLLPSLNSFSQRTKAHHSNIPIFHTTTNFITDSQLDFFSPMWSDDLPDMYMIPDASSFIIQNSESDRSSLMSATFDEQRNELDSNSHTTTTSKSLYSSVFSEETSPSKYLPSTVTRLSPTVVQETQGMSPVSGPSTKDSDRSSLSSLSALPQTTSPPIVGIEASYNISFLLITTNSFETSTIIENASEGNKLEKSTSLQFSSGYLTSSNEVKFLRDLTTKYLSTMGSHTRTFSLDDGAIISSSSERFLTKDRSVYVKSPSKENAHTMQTLEVSWFTSSQYLSGLLENTIKSHEYSIMDEFTVKHTRELSKSTDKTDNISFTVSNNISSGVVKSSLATILVSAMSSSMYLQSQNFASSSSLQIISSKFEIVESSVALQPSDSTFFETYKEIEYMSLVSRTNIATFKSHTETEPLISKTRNSLDLELPSVSEPFSGSAKDLYKSSAEATAKLPSSLVASTTNIIEQTLAKKSTSSVPFASSIVDIASAEPSTISVTSVNNSMSTHSSAFLISSESVTLDPEKLETSKHLTSKTQEEYFETLESSLRTSYFIEMDSSSDGDTFTTQTLPLYDHKPTIISSSSYDSEKIVNESIQLHSETREESLTVLPQISNEQSLNLKSTSVRRVVSQSSETLSPALEEGGSFSDGSMFLFTSNIVSKSTKIKYSPFKFSTLFHETEDTSSKVFITGVSSNISTLPPSVSTPVLSTEIESSPDSLRITTTSQTSDRSTDSSSDDASSITTSLRPTSTTNYIVLSTGVFIASTSIYPSSPTLNSSNLLTMKILVKPSINLSNTDLREELGKGILCSFYI